MKNYKRIGVLGGMSPETTVEFYHSIIREHFNEHGDYAYPEVVIFSVNFKRIIDLQESGDMETYTNELMRGVESLESSGVDFIVIASNTPHMVFNQLEQRSKVPILSIVKNTADRAQDLSLSRVLLLGTKFTMQASFYKNDFLELGIEVSVPSEPEQLEVNRIIFEELVLGEIKKSSKDYLLGLINKYPAKGIILGCTELSLIIGKKDTNKVLLDTLQIHINATLRYAQN